MKFNDLIKWKGYIYLKELTEPEGNALRLIVGRSKEVHSGFGIKHFPAIQVDFDFYISYSVLNECFDTIDETEISDGKVFRIYKKSNYKKYIKSTAIEREDICPPKDYVHYQLCCLDHIIDIISCEEPTVVELSE